jgi:hypothetical protein
VGLLDIYAISGQSVLGATPEIGAAPRIPALI